MSWGRKTSEEAHLFTFVCCFQGTQVSCKHEGHGELLNTDGHGELPHREDCTDRVSPPPSPDGACNLDGSEHAVVDRAESKLASAGYTSPQVGCLNPREVRMQLTPLLGVVECSNFTSRVGGCGFTERERKAGRCHERAGRFPFGCGCGTSGSD